MHKMTWRLRNNLTFQLLVKKDLIVQSSRLQTQRFEVRKDLGITLEIFSRVEKRELSLLLQRLSNFHLSLAQTKKSLLKR